LGSPSPRCRLYVPDIPGGAADDLCHRNRLQNSRTGRAWVAIREDEVAARATGINTFQSKLLALAIGAAFAGLGGVLFASRNQFTGPEDHS
jgi:ABC-type branched-subunit amino acid transport system permease subunit